MRFFTSWSCYSCFDDGIRFCNSQLYLNFSSIQSIKWAARQMWNERLSQLVLLQSTFSLPLHIHLWVDKFTLRVVTVAASDITLMCMFVRFLHYHNLSVCVRECVCVRETPGESVRDFKALAASPIDERAVPMFIVTCFSTQGLHKKTSRDGGINGIKKEEEKTVWDKYCKHK